MTTATDSPRTHPVLDGLDAIIQPLENLYRDLHAHPELSDHEKRAAAKAAEQLERAGCEVSTGVGGTGAQAMIDDHLFGRGGHGAWPEATIDPIVMAAGAVLRLQTIVAREIAAFEPAVLTIGSVQAGTKGNLIPDQAVLKINVRSFDDGVRARVLDTIKRIVTPEATASGAPEPPSFKSFDHFDLTIDDPATAIHVGDAFRAYFGADRVTHLTDPLPVSEDFGPFGQEWKVPSLFWYVGGTDPGVYNRAAQAGRIAQDVPTNHSSKFAPVLHPTLETGIQTLATATLSYLGK
jgi:metal-dependent amidase/aminoacylase/carboxypeptidase family protein